MTSANLRTNFVDQITSQLTVLLITFIVLTPFLFSQTALAADFAGMLKGVTITDARVTNTPPTAMIKYTQESDTFNFNAGESTDSDGNIVEYRWDFGDGEGGVGSTVNHDYFGYGDFSATLSVIDDKGGVHVVQQNVRIEPVNVSINFQPETAAIPNNFLADVGGSFDIVKGFGWVVGPEDVLRARDRDSSLSTGQEYDTLFPVAPNALWEYKVPNGSYFITICVGDPSYPDGIQAVQAEGGSVIEERLDYNARWIEKKSVLEVRDGKVSITFVGSGEGDADQIARLCWVRIQSN